MVPAGLRQLTHLFEDLLRIDGGGWITDDRGGWHRLRLAAYELRDGTIGELGGEIPSSEVDDGQGAEADTPTVGGKASSPSSSKSAHPVGDFASDVDARDCPADLLGHCAVASERKSPALVTRRGSHAHHGELALRHDPVAKNHGGRQLALDSGDTDIRDDRRRH